MTILILRPAAKYQTSATFFNQHQLSTVGLALIDTAPAPKALNSLANLSINMPASCKTIFISTTAAQLITQARINWPASMQCFAVGQSTAQILNQAGMQCIIPTSFSTEGLLALPELRTIKNIAVYIFKGEGGRTDLSQTLKQRGAHVSEINLYHRVKLLPPKATQAWQTQDIQCIIATSGEQIEAAFDHFPADWLTSVPWIVVSQRTADIAQRLGVQHTVQCVNASDPALLHQAQTLLGATYGRQ